MAFTWRRPGLVVDIEFDPPAVFELVERVLLWVDGVGFQELANIGNRFAVIHVTTSLGQAVAPAKVAKVLEQPG